MKHLKYYSNTWFTRSVCPFVWGWYANDKLIFTCKILNKDCQNLDVNCVPRSKMMSSGSPWYLYTFSKKSRAVALPVIFLLQGMKCAIFVKRSTTTKTESKDLDFGRSTMKSMDIDVHGVFGIDSGWSNLYGRWRGILDPEQVSHVVT